MTGPKMGGRSCRRPFQPALVVIGLVPSDARTLLRGKKAFSRDLEPARGGALFQ